MKIVDVHRIIANMDAERVVFVSGDVAEGVGLGEEVAHRVERLDEDGAGQAARAHLSVSA